MDGSLGSCVYPPGQALRGREVLFSCFCAKKCQFGAIAVILPCGRMENGLQGLSASRMGHWGSCGACERRRWLWGAPLDLEGIVGQFGVYFLATRRRVWVWHGLVLSSCSPGPSDGGMSPAWQPGIAHAADLWGAADGRSIKSSLSGANAWWEADKGRVCEIIPAPWEDPGGEGVFCCAAQRPDRGGNAQHS